MSTEVNKALVGRFREAHTMKNLALLDEIVAADIKSHSGMQGLPIGFKEARWPTKPSWPLFPMAM